MAVICCSFFMLAGCASNQVSESIASGSERAERPLACGPELEGRAAMHFDLIEQMADQGRDRAALAHLDALSSIQITVPVEAKLLRAHAHRRLGESDKARDLYIEIAGSCMPGQGMRGLALLAAQRGDVQEAVERFRKAIDHRPVDARLRNDLGYAYLLQGRLDKAREELETARELGGGEKAVSNLIVLLLHQGEYDKARSIASESGIDEQKWRSLGREAQQIQAAESGESG
ncbi:tetratricopeptide repeat protein [uncultured Halovibrio sp.]|uniref:tetratricopeptide repeat protein n=1 Tax=uncultured Halovibrio sp. TaxID=985049 RepID=UPI0025F0247A|nr:tetratricopeptide repeat protein [uncultured Halovibrio sp.]